MDLTHIHLLLNHFPTIGMIIGGGLFLQCLHFLRQLFFSTCQLGYTMFKCLTITGSELFLLQNEFPRCPNLSGTAPITLPSARAPPATNLARS